ncbi:MAG: lipopolysaccharide heptosyltransferase II, partial [Candidatus Hydrogenedentes bacterium]|nr:lipopolysaccharide heptosyltransferase II [Candidatus Hydrogenedentota bacterium]
MKHLLALVPNWVGDVAMCTPALRALARRYPESELTVAGRSVACELLDGLPYLHRFVKLPAKPGLFAMIEAARALRPHARDAAIVFPHSARAAILARLAGAQRRIGYARGRRAWLLTDAVEPHRVNGVIEPVYMTAEYLDLLAPLDCTDDGNGLELHASQDALARVSPHLEGASSLVGIAPGAAFGPSKLWPAERFAAVADGLAEKAGARCVLFTGPGEEATRDAVLRHARHPLVQYDDGAPSIAKLKAAISKLDLLVCNDSGTRHVAVAFGVPVVCIMGPTSPKYSCGPYEKGEVLRVDVDCGPCQKPVCTTDHRCMTRVTAEWVLGVAMRALA